MKKVELEQKDLEEKQFYKILFFMIAEGGAMGEPGAINFITDDGTLYHLNYVFGGFNIQDVIKAFPMIAECEFGLFGFDSKVPKDWNYVNLGMGNHLIVKTKVFLAFSKLITKYKSPGEIYQNWVKHAKRVIKNNIKEVTKNDDLS
ncbi:MAG: hypothetical protein IKB86_05765 [Clostridia bacterium]|nr:hypothetical protein [Clostridia bacterium]